MWKFIAWWGAEKVKALRAFRYWTLNDTLYSHLEDEELGYVRESVAYDKNGVQVAANTPVYDDGIRTVKETTNLVDYSNDLSQWTSIRCTISVDATTAPDGGTADKIEEADFESNTPYINTSIAGEEAKHYFVSFYAKAAERDVVRLLRHVGDSYEVSYFTDFNLGTNTITRDDSNTAYMKDVGGGWYYCSALLGLASADPANISPRIQVNWINYNSTVGHGLYIWGIQVEQSSIRTPLQITEATPSTRTPSRLTLPKSDLPDTFKYSVTYRPDHASTTALKRGIWREGGYYCFIDTDNKAYFTNGIVTAETSVLTFAAEDDIYIEAGRLDDELFIRAKVEAGAWVSGTVAGAAVITGGLLYLGNRQTGLYFDGVDDNLAIVDDQDITGTVEFWMKGGSTAGDLVDFTGDGGAGTITHDATDIIATSGTVYVNGSAGDTYTQDSLMHVAVAGMTIDSANSILIADGYKGSLYDFRLWNTTRTAQQIADNMHKRLVGNEAGLQLYLPMDEATGTTANDLTANANHGTITGASWQAIDSANGHLYDKRYFEGSEVS